MDDVQLCAECRYYKEDSPYEEPVCLNPYHIQKVNLVTGKKHYKTCNHRRSNLENTCPEFERKGLRLWMLFIVIVCLIGVYRVF